ncbi:MAG: septum formation initiator family protein [Vicinamibacterales bacterium]
MPHSQPGERFEHAHRLVPPRRSASAWFRRALIFATCCVLADALFGDSGLAAKMRAQRNYLATESQLRTLRNENAGLRAQVRRPEGDAGEIEDVARNELGLIRPGEMLFVVKNVR